MITKSPEYQIEEKEIGATLRAHFDGLYFNDLAALKRLLHSKALYVSANSGACITKDMNDYFDVLK